MFEKRYKKDNNRKSNKQVGALAILIALIKRRPAWDQDHLDADEELPTIYFNPDKITGSYQSKFDIYDILLIQN